MLSLFGFLQGEEAFRLFTDVEGRKIMARIHNSDGQNVHLELHDGKGFITTIDIFSPVDQEYIRNWRPKPPEKLQKPFVDESEAELRDGFYYKLGEESGITGTLVSKFVDDTYKAQVGLKYGLQHGPTVLWHETGGKMARATFLEGRQTGVTTFWYSSGEDNKKTESAYLDGLQHGLTTFWHENGQKKAEGIWNRGQRESMHAKWHDNGKKNMEINYSAGRPHGPGASWHSNGQKKMEGHWANGVKHGLYSEWYENGQQKMEILYEDGIVQGKPTYWNTKGKKTRKKPASGTTEARPPEAKPVSTPLFTAQSGTSSIVRYFGMISIPKDVIWTSSRRSSATQADNDLEFGKGFVIGLGAGRDFGFYKMEIEGAYHFFSPSGIVYDLDYPPWRGPASATGDVTLYSLQLNNYLEFEFTPPTEFYGGAGLGLSYVDLILKRNGPTLAASGFKFAYQFMAGVNYNFSGRHNFTGGYKYFITDDLGRFEGMKTHNFEFGYKLDL